MKAVVAAFNQEKALVGAFSVITNLRMELFQALVDISSKYILGRETVPLSHNSMSWLYTELFLVKTVGDNTNVFIWVQQGTQIFCGYDMYYKLKQ